MFETFAMYMNTRFGLKPGQFVIWFRRSVNISVYFIRQKQLDVVFFINKWVVNNDKLDREYKLPVISIIK